MKKISHRFLVLISLLSITQNSSQASDVNRFEEAALLKKYSKFVKKVGDEYEISCGDKKNVFLQNVISDDDSVKIYALDDYFSNIGYLGFDVGHYEWGGYELVNLQNCNVVSLGSKPKVSPDGKTLLITAYDEGETSDEDAAGNLFIFKNEKGSINRIQNISVNNLYFRSWIDSTKAIFYNPSQDANEKNFTLSFDAKLDKWLLEDATNKKEYKYVKQLTAPLPKEEKPENIQNDPQLALLSISQDPSRFAFCSEKLRGDEEFVMQAILKAKQSYRGKEIPYEFISSELKNNKAFMMKALKETRGNELVKIASEKLKDDEEFIEALNSKNGFAIQYASDRLKDNESFVGRLLYSSFTYCLISNRLRNREDIFLKAKNLECAPAMFANNAELVLQIMAQNQGLYERMDTVSPKLLSDKSFVVEAIKNYSGFDFEDIKSSLPKKIRENPEVLQAIKNRIKYDPNQSSKGIIRVPLNPGYRYMVYNIEKVVVDISKFNLSREEVIKRITQVDSDQYKSETDLNTKYDPANQTIKESTARNYRSLPRTKENELKKDDIPYIYTVLNLPNQQILFFDGIDKDEFLARIDKFFIGFSADSKQETKSTKKQN